MLSHIFLLLLHSVYGTGTYQRPKTNYQSDQNFFEFKSSVAKWHWYFETHHIRFYHHEVLRCCCSPPIFSCGAWCSRWRGIVSWLGWKRRMRDEWVRNIPHFRLRHNLIIFDVVYLNSSFLLPIDPDYMLVSCSESCARLESDINSLYDVVETDIDGKDISFDSFRGSIVYIVNVASQCGYTAENYELFRKLQQYRSSGLITVIAPCNQVSYASYWLDASQKSELLTSNSIV